MRASSPPSRRRLERSERRGAAGGTIALGLLLAGCAVNPPPLPAVSTPEQVVATAVAGSAVTVEGTVFTTSFDSVEVDPHQHDLLGGRYLLVRTTRPRGVSYGDIDPNRLPEAWSLGLHLSPAQLAARTFPLPAEGDVVRASGIFELRPWSRGAWQPEGVVLPMLRDLSALVIVTSSAAPAAEPGEGCRVDMDCSDDLLCDRTTLRCQPPAIVPAWGSDFRGVNGACASDGDCPAGEQCDLAYRIRGDGEYAAYYRRQSDLGRGLCVPPRGARESLFCPRVGTTAALVGGRYALGKEVCVRGEVIVAVMPEDRDTHVQLRVDEGLPYPRASAGYEWFGATAETSPPYKDPSRPGGALGDPPAGQRVLVLGTYRYDGDHGWFEVHPIKAIWRLP